MTTMSQINSPKSRRWYIVSRTLNTTFLSKLVLAVMLAVMVSALPGTTLPVHAFSIDAWSTLVPDFVGDPSTGNHEQITATAINGAKSPDGTQSLSEPAELPNVILNLNRGVENTDITHQFDCDSHMDDSSVSPITPAALNCDGQGFPASFTLLWDRLMNGLKAGSGNNQFLHPTFQTFSEVVTSAVNAFNELNSRPDCSANSGCANAAAIAKTDAADYTPSDVAQALFINPNPDPFPVTNPESIFSTSVPPSMQPCGPCGMLGDTMASYQQLVMGLQQDMQIILGTTFADSRCTCMQTLDEMLGSNDGTVQKLHSVQDQVNAYIAFQYIGHALHTTEDFFAHSNYIELVGAVQACVNPVPALVLGCPASAKTPLIPGTSLGMFGVAPSDMLNLVPQDYSLFTFDHMMQYLQGIGAGWNSLQTGAIQGNLLNEGDYCVSSNDSYYNPTGLVGKFLNLVTGNLPSSWPGSNPNPPSGFNYCHYSTSTTTGLNKDESDVTTPTAGVDPCASPPSIDTTKLKELEHINFFYACTAAQKMAAELWTYVRDNVGPTTKATESRTYDSSGKQIVDVHLHAEDTSGYNVGVTSINWYLTGAQVDAGSFAGADGDIHISTGGTTTVHFFATGGNGKVEQQAKTYAVRTRAPSSASPNYDYKVIATTTSSSSASAFRTLGIGPSINDWGEVAYTGFTDQGSGIYLADATGVSRLVNPSFATNGLRRFDDIVEVNNSDTIAAGDRVSGSPPSYRIRIWDGRPGVINSYQTLDASATGLASATGVVKDPSVPVAFSGNPDLWATDPAGFTLAAGSSTQGFNFDSVLVPVMNNYGQVAWDALSGGQWYFASGAAPNIQNSFNSWTGNIRQVITDDGHIVARAGGDAPAPGEPYWAADAPVVMWDTNYAGDQTIVCQSGCAHPGFSAIGRFVGANDDSSVIAFAATGPQGIGIYASVRAQIDQSTPDGRVVVPVVLTSALGPISQIEGTFRIDVNSTEKSAERAVEIAFMADNSNGDKGIWVSRLNFIGNADGTYDPEHPTALCASVTSPQCVAVPPQMVVQQGATVPGLSGAVGDVYYYDPLNNRNTGDLAFWVSMTDGTQAIVRARPQCGSTNYAAGTEPSSTYINQYAAGVELGLIKATDGNPGGNACGPSSLSMAINLIQHARGVAAPGKVADLVSVYGDGQQTCTNTTTSGVHCTPNGVMRLSDNSGGAITNGANAVYDRERAIAILKSKHWVTTRTDGQAGLDLALSQGKIVVQSTTFGTGAQRFGSDGSVPAPPHTKGQPASPTGNYGGGHMVLFVGKTPTGDYIVDDPAGDFMTNPLNGGQGVHYGPVKNSTPLQTICGQYVIYPKSTVAMNIAPNANSPNGRPGLALQYQQNQIDPDVLLVQAFPTGTTGRSFNMWVTDTSGNQAGFPTGDSSPVSNIPGSEAQIDPLLPSDPASTGDDLIPPSNFPYSVLIVNPPANLQVHITGQAASSYQLEFTHFNNGVETSSAVLDDSVASGGSKTVPIVGSPIATAQTVQARQETPKSIQLAGADPANQTLTFAVATQPTNGTLSAVDANGNVVYTPGTGYSGPDTFTFTSNNGVITSQPATVSITVNPNSPPLATDLNATVSENQVVPIKLSGSAPSGQPITFAAGQPANGTVTLNGSTATYAPNQYFYGTDTFTYTVNDGYLTSSAATVTVIVQHVNQPAVVTLTAPQSINEGSPPAPISATVTYPDGDPSTIQWSTNLGSLIGNGTSATFTADDGPSTATVSVTATTSHGLTTVATATIQVLNVPPTVSVGPAQTKSWGLPVTLTGNATDPSAADTAAGLNPTWSFGDATANAPGYSLTHTYANPGSYAAKLTATDKDGGVGSATVGVTVTKRGSSLAYTGSTTAPYGFVTLSAKLADLVDGPSARLAGHKVTFLVGTQAFAAVTDATGTATVVPPPIAPGSYSVAAVFSTDSLYLSSSARATLVVSNSVGSSTGTTLVPATGGTASFSVTSTGSTTTGTLDYSNGTTVVHATSLVPFGIRPDGHAAWFSGVDTLGRKITVYVEDNGSGPADVFKLSINGVAQTGSGALTGGTVQVVKS